MHRFSPRFLSGLALVVALAWPLSGAHAEIYRWTDASGSEHFTMDPNEIPARYRAQAIEAAKNRRQLQVIGPGSGSGRSPSSARGNQTGGSSYRFGNPAAPAPHGGAQRAETPGGKNRAWWESQHRRVRDHVKRYESQLERVEQQKRTSQERYSLHTRERGKQGTTRMGDSGDALRFAEDALRKAKQDHDDFHMQARRAGVPPGWVRD